MANGDTFKTLAELEADQIRAVFSHHDGNMSRCAQTLGIDRRTMYRKARELGLKTRSTSPLALAHERIRELEAKLGGA
jgi:DNA-binding NtrC family response regulator